MANIPNTDSKLVWVKAMARGQCFPLDSTEIWDSLEDAQNYAQTDSVAYVGQTLKVKNADSVDVYVIKDISGTLAKLADIDAVNKAIAEMPEVEIPEVEPIPDADIISLFDGLGE